MKYKLIYISLIAWLLSACNLEQEVDLKLPEYEPQVVAESYLQPGNPYILTLVRSTGYFEGIAIDFVRDAEVTISHLGTEVTLSEFGIPLDLQIPGGGVFDTSLLRILGPIVGDTLYVYASLEEVPEVYDTEFQLAVNIPDGTQLRAKTVIPSPVPIDTMEWRFNQDSMAFVLTKWQDDPNTANFYRRLFEDQRERKVVVNGDTTTQFQWREEQDFNFDDEIQNGELITIGSNFEYKLGDSLRATLFHITGDYYYFLESTDAAIIANLSPFAQPASIRSNIQGGIGIFTGFSQTQRILVVGE